MMRLRQVTWLALVWLAVVLAGAPLAHAQSEWNPFRDKDEAALRAKKPPVVLPPPLAPMGGSLPQPEAPNGPATNQGPPGFGAAYPGTEAPPPYARPLPGTPAGPQTAAASKVERLELEPAPARDGSGLPQDAWRGLDVAAVEDNFATLNLPPRSAVLHALWRRLLNSSAEAPAGGQAVQHFEALRMEALYRSGLIGDMGERLQAAPAGDPIFAAFSIRRDLAAGDRGAGCQTAKALMGKRAGLPKALVGELHLLSGYCAAVEGNAAGAGLAAELAREEGVDAPVALAALDALAGNGRGGLAPPKLLRVLDYRLLELLGPIDPVQILDKAEPALLTALALQAGAEPRLRVAAAEAAAKLNAIAPEQLAVIYRTVPAGSSDPLFRRAELVRAVEAEVAPVRKLQLGKTALEDGRRAGLGLPMARVLAPLMAGLAPSQELRADAETAVEILLAARDTRRARDFASGGARHWLPLVDIADSSVPEGVREQNLDHLDELVRRGRLPANLLHQLATVLDATDVNVPIPLWEAASRTPQPSAGFLPETGVLAQLQDAAKKNEAARTILLSLRALGPAGADGVQIIALGDTIRALRRAGFDADARRLGVEALIAQWPRGGAL